MNTSRGTWRPGDQTTRPQGHGDVYRPDILEVIEKTVDELNPALRELSLDILKHPELSFQERYAHDVYTAFMEKQGFVVQRHYLLETAWVATYSHGQSGPVLGLNSEMDALPGIGHACGHNLIGISGVAIACAAKAAMEKLSINGKVILLGTPGEEAGAGKVRLLNKGAYEEMDVCLMCHPGPGRAHSVSLAGTLALTDLRVDYAGHTAHAGLSPWEGKNALDAAVLAYTSIGLLRQQIRPTHRVHGVFGGQDWAPNIIPDKATMRWAIRAPTTKEMLDTLERAKACFESAASMTGCTVKITVGLIINELVQNPVLGAELCKKFGVIDHKWGIASASTDFGAISYGIVPLPVYFRFIGSSKAAMPAVHAFFSIPTVPGGKNHTPAFAEAAGTETAHEACLDMSKALAAVGMRVLTDGEFLSQVKLAFEKEKKSWSD